MVSPSQIEPASIRDSDMILRLESITKSFGGVRALRGVSLDLRPGEIHAIVGENGAGKSTLIRIITGAHRPDSGAIFMGANRLDKLSPQTARARGVFAIYQQPALFPDLTVSENLEMSDPDRNASWLGSVNLSQRRLRAANLLSRVGARISPDEWVSNLSMPEQQLVEISKAIGAGARVLIMDEPTASLSAADVATLVGITRQLRDSGVGILYISHRLDEVFELSDRITVLRDGESLGTYVTSSLDKQGLVRMMVGRELSAEYPSSAGGFGTDRLVVQALAASYAGSKSISLRIRSGEVVTMAGLVGAGRTEFARVLFGITPADSGQILLDGERVTIKNPEQAIHYGICYVPEDRRRHGLISDFSILENLTLAGLRQLAGTWWLDAKKELSTAEFWIQELKIKALNAEFSAGNLSGGNQQKVVLAKWLALSPKVLILDEPTQGVDVGSKHEIHCLIRRFADLGMAVLVISSDMSEVMGLGDRILVMAKGSLVAEFRRDESSAERILHAALGEPIRKDLTNDLGR